MMTLFGYGKTTKALAQKYGNAIFYEEIDKPYMDEDGFWHYPIEAFDPDTSTLEIPSPGIPPSHPLIQRAKNLISEYDYFYATMPYSIWVSGTNGKTTTTQMITHLLKDKGAISGGNIGTPLAVMDERAPIWVLESSSFTLHYTHRAKPNIYILLPITPDHLSWHGSFEAYEEAKLKPIRSLKEGELAIVPNKYANIETQGMIVGYEGIDDLASFFDIDSEKIAFEGAFLLDALLAMAVRKALFFDTPYDIINQFRLDPHKQEEFVDTQGRLWVDDSKATNIDATIEALKRYRNRRIHLILGGESKGVDLEPLFSHLHGVKVYAIGTASQEIVHLCEKYGIAYYHAQTLEDAVAAIKRELTCSEVALLSPACASFDQFSSYKERGERFKSYVLS